MKPSCCSNRIIPIYVLLSLFIIAIAACSNTPPLKVDLNKRDIQTSLSPLVADSMSSPPLRLAISGLMTPVETLRGYKDFITYLEEKLGIPVKLVQRGSQAQINALMQARQVDMALLCPLPYVQGYRAFGMELLAIVVHRGKVDHYSNLLVPRDSLITSIKELRGRTFAFSDPDSCTGWLAPAYQLALTGETPTSFFSKQVFTYTHENNARLVASKLVDGAAIDSLAYEYLEAVRPDLIAKTQVVAQWGPLPSPPMVVHPDLNEGLKALLKYHLLNMDKDPKGRQALNKLQIDEFLQVNDNAYDVIRQMEYQVKMLIKGGR